MKRAVIGFGLALAVLAVGGGLGWWGTQVGQKGGLPKLLSEPTVVSDPLPPAERFQGYDFRQPTRSFTLPSDLRELSALTDVDANTVAGVQDEQGIVFFIDVHTGTVTHRVPFGEAGDYEGLTRVGSALWVLRSDGWLGEIVQEGSRFVLRKEWDLDLAHQDFEGLGYDPGRGRLLVAPKDRPAGNQEEKARRRVYLVDPSSGKTEAAFALDTSLPRMRGDAMTQGLALPEKITKKGNVKSTLQLHFSSIALHPVTGELYALSASDDAVFAFDRESRLTASHLFRGAGMEQVEGMTFLPNGDLVIASEGVERPAQMQVFAARWHSAGDAQGRAGEDPSEGSAPIDE